MPHRPGAMHAAVVQHMISGYQDPYFFHNVDPQRSQRPADDAVGKAKRPVQLTLTCRLSGLDNDIIPEGPH